MTAGRLTIATSGGASATRDLDAWLSPTLRERVREEAYRWIKSLRVVSSDGQPMRTRFRYRGDSLWWFTELYLHKMRRLETAVATILALDAAQAQDAPARLTVDTADPTVRTAAAAYREARGVPLEIAGATTRSRASARWTSWLVGGGARMSRWRPSRHAAPRRGTIAAFVHNAFWQSSADDDGGREHYVGPVLSALGARVGADGLTPIGLGPRRHFRAHRWWDPRTPRDAGPRVIPIETLAPRAAIAPSLDLWRRRDALAAALTSGPGIREAGRVLNCDLWPILRAELEEAARIQWPWSARAMDEAGAALDALAPRSVVTYAEAGGWGRALMLEARRRGVPSVGVQHGFIYRHWLNYRHEPDEIEALDGDGGFPRPDLTLAFDGYAAGHLTSAAHFPPEAVAVTGSPRLDELAARVRALASDRAALRADLGAGDGALVVVASKFTEIQAELAALFEATAARASTHVIVKPHPADRADDYRRPAAGRTHVRVADAGADLGRLLAAADAVVTVNSTVALDALALGIPALVLGLPNNLSPFVDAGLMAGAPRDGVGAALDALLYDRAALDRWRQRAAEYARTHAMTADGHAADRAADAILAATRRARPTPAPPDAPQRSSE